MNTNPHVVSHIAYAMHPLALNRTQTIHKHYNQQLLRIKHNYKICLYLGTIQGHVLTRGHHFRFQYTTKEVMSNIFYSDYRIYLVMSQFYA